jgi:hypothetical protein
MQGEFAYRGREICHGHRRCRLDTKHSAALATTLIARAFTGASLIFRTFDERSRTQDCPNNIGQRPLASNEFADAPIRTYWPANVRGGAAC